MDFVKEIATFLVKSNALQFGVFKLSSGKESPYYIDLRILPSFPQYFRYTIAAYKKALENIGFDKFDYLCSLPTSGLVYASSLSYVVGKPLVYVRKEAKEHGTSKMLEGYLRPGAEVVIIDDVATTGGSIVEAVEAVRSNGGVVNNAIVLIDRLEGASQILKQNGVKLISVAKISEIVNTLFDMGALEEEVLSAVKKQITENV
ncbi:MAG: orotate phosphoribosyltransferase [Nitrososphaerales archaeon]